MPAPADKDFAWFDALGLPGVTGCRYLRAQGAKVGEGPVWRFHWEPNEQSWGVGFQADKTAMLAIDFSELAQHRLRASVEDNDPGPPPFRTLQEAASLYLKEVTKILEAQGPYRIPNGFEARRRSHTFILARACQANGLAELAKDLAALAEKSYGGQKWKEPAPPVIESVRNEIAHDMMWRAILAFKDPTIPREALLARFEGIIDRFPQSEHVTRARDTADLLRRMVEEDRQHAKEATPLEELARAPKIAELIFMLREQRGFQNSQPGTCDIFESEDGKEDSPAHRLFAIGYEAIPQLIEALDDRRFTRAVEFGRDFRFSHFVLRVGDCSRAIIERIAGRKFVGRDAALEWWTDFKVKGEKQSLVSGVRAGDDNSPLQAERLVERFPAEALEALEALMAGARNARGMRPRHALIRIAAKLEGNGPVPFLLEELRNAPFLSSRVQAAYGLHKRGRSEAVQAMIEEWQALPAPAAQGESGFEEHFEEQRAREALIWFLARCDRPEAIEAMRRLMRERPIDARLDVIHSLYPNRPAFATWHFEVGAAAKEPIEESPEVRAAIEHLLVEALQDTAEVTGLSGAMDGKSYKDPRVCDIAGHVLWKRWPGKYQFDISGPLAERDKQRASLQSSWIGGR